MHIFVIKTNSPDSSGLCSFKWFYNSSEMFLNKMNFYVVIEVLITRKH